MIYRFAVGRLNGRPGPRDRYFVITEDDRQAYAAVRHPKKLAELRIDPVVGLSVAQVDPL